VPKAILPALSRAIVADAENLAIDRVLAGTASITCSCWESAT
jgi:hypothetical protein